jgi:hypothetical protein
VNAAGLKKWAFALVPAAALLELGAHFVQTSSGVVPDADWEQAREIVRGKLQEGDLLLFSPRWTDPLGRQHFKDELASVEREAYPDVTRFARAFEVSIRGAHARELAGWREVARERAGAVSIVTWENPAPAKVIDDLVARAARQEMRVTRVDGPRQNECPFGQYGAQTGGLGFGPAVPSARWACPGGNFAGVTVLPALDYSPRRCIYAPPAGSGSALRLVFPGVHFGRTLHGHHGLYVEAERNKNGAPVTLTLRTEEPSPEAAGQIDSKVLAQFVHRDGAGWSGFELDTSDLAGKTVDLVAEITSPNGSRRMYCFEADTR